MACKGDLSPLLAPNHAESFVHSTLPGDVTSPAGIAAHPASHAVQGGLPAARLRLCRKPLACRSGGCGLYPHKYTALTL